MAKAQFPIDGKPGKAWKVTSTMGWRMHPVKKTKRHHNGTDIWAAVEPCWIEAPFDGKVIASGKTSVLGNFVVLRHKIAGKPYVTRYLHMKDGSLKVKNGQAVSAGTPLGKMGTTGMSTGKHLHWELQAGKSLVYNETGKGFIEPVAFFKALIAHEAIVATAPLATPVDAPVSVMPAHSIEAPVTPAPVPVVSVPVRGTIKEGSHGADVKYLQQKLGIGADGIFGPGTKKAVVGFQVKHDLVADGVVGPKTWKVVG